MASFVENYSVELRMHCSEQSSDIVVEDMLMEAEAEAEAEVEVMVR